MDSTTQLIALLVILVVFVLNFIVRRRRVPMRPIAAYSILPTLANESIEAARPLHLSLGSATIGDNTTLFALAGADFLYYAVREATLSDAPPIITVTNSTAISLGLDILRRAYRRAGMLERYRPTQVRWYPQGGRSLAFAGGIMAMQSMGEDGISANILAGRFGTELALILWSSQARGRPSVATSDQIEGQAVAMAMADYPLLGDELFAAPGYLDDSLALNGRNVTIDLTRFLLALAIVALMIYTLVTGANA